MLWAKPLTPNPLKTAVQRQIDPTDRDIDQRFYGLYALTDEDIRIVKQGKARRISSVLWGWSR